MIARRYAWLVGTAAALGATATSAQAQTRAATAPIYPSSAPERDTTSRLSAARLDSLAPRLRAQWTAYLRRSDSLHAVDRATVAAELRAAGKTAWVAAPYVHAFTIDTAWHDGWFATESARRLADHVLSWQTPAGGWSKHVDMEAQSRQAGESYFSESAEWQWIGTFDNDATTTQLFLLGHVNMAQKDPRYRRAFDRGLAYVLAAQYPNGCWPQVYPLQGGYHDNATYNDDNMAEIAVLLRAVAHGGYPFVSPATRQRAARATARLTDCIVASQVTVNGTLTVWGQQHDPLSLRPTSARSYELPSLTGKESAHLVDVMMDDPHPDARIVRAVHAAAAWFRQNAIRGYSYLNYVRTLDSTAGPLWARMAEIGTNRAMFFNRDGVRHYDWDALTDRRTGYAWYTDAPAATLARYESWAREHPLRGEAGR